MKNEIDALYLHGGPGCSTVLERHLWKERLPVEWWEQPTPDANAASAYDDLVQAVEDKLTCRAQDAGGPVPIIGHSFGCVLALEMARRVPQHIASLCLMAPVSNLYSVFENFGQLILEDQPELTALSDALAALRGAREPGAFWNLVGNVMAVPTFLDYYWGPKSDQQRDFANQVLAQHTLFNPPFFQAIVNEVLNRELAEAPGGFHGPVQIIQGRFDPLIDLDAELAVWLTRFPHAETVVADTGHLIPLEWDDDRWWKPSGG